VVDNQRTCVVLIEHSKRNIYELFGMDIEQFVANVVSRCVGIINFFTKPLIQQNAANLSAYYLTY